MKLQGGGENERFLQKKIEKYKHFINVNNDFARIPYLVINLEKGSKVGIIKMIHHNFNEYYFDETENLK